MLLKNCTCELNLRKKKIPYLCNVKSAVCMTGVIKYKRRYFYALF